LSESYFQGAIKRAGRVPGCRLRSECRASSAARPSRKDFREEKRNDEHLSHPEEGCPVIAAGRPSF